jgi:hypothetical protein
MSRQWETKPVESAITSREESAMARHNLSVPLIVALLSLGVSAKADETLKYRAIMHGVSVQPQDVGDVDGHSLTLVRFSGITEFPDGTTGTGYFVGVADYTKGAGKGFTYSNLTLEDGSVLWFTQDQKTRVDGTKSIFEGTITVIGGKGRFAGAKGDGKFTGARTVPLAAGADLYFDYVINLKK